MVDGQETPGMQPAPAPQGQTPPPGQGAPPQQPQPPQQPPYYPPPRSQRGFFGRLFDFSFQEFVTPTLIKVIFGVALVVIVLSIVGAIIVGFMAGAGTGVMAIIGSLIYGFLALLWIRVLLELTVVFFRIRESTEEIAGRKR